MGVYSPLGPEHPLATTPTSHGAASHENPLCRCAVNPRWAATMEPAMIDLQDARERMVDRQLSRRGVHDEGVLDAMRIVPREVFVPEGMEEFAYDDAPPCRSPRARPFPSPISSA